MPLSDDEFIAAWREGRGSPDRVAEITGMGIRGVYSRRQKLSRRGINLETVATTPQGAAQGVYTQAWSYTRERQATVENGHVVTFSDAHFWPGSRTVANEALLKVIKILKPARIIANGDVFDGARISRHDPHGWGQPPSVKEELDACLLRMHEIALAARRGTPLDWNIGNHCQRFDRALAINAGQYDGVVERLSDKFPEWEMAWSIRLNGSVMVKHRQANGADDGDGPPSPARRDPVGRLHRASVGRRHRHSGRSARSAVRISGEQRDPLVFGVRRLDVQGREAPAA